MFKFRPIYSPLFGEFICLLVLISLFLSVYVYVGGGEVYAIYMKVALKGQKYVSDPKGPELQVVVNLLTTVLGIEIRSSGRAVWALWWFE